MVYCPKAPSHSNSHFYLLIKLSQKKVISFFSFFFFFFLVFLSLTAALAACGGSQARGRIRAVVAGLTPQP